MEYQQFKRPYKLIAFDIDMTLTNHERDVHPEDKAILQELNNRGVHIALASGRMTFSILTFAQTHLEFETDVIAYNGAMVWVQGNDKPVSHEPLPFETALKIAELEKDLQRQGVEVSLNCYLNDELYSEKQTWLTDIYRQRTKSVYNFTGESGKDFIQKTYDNDGSLPTKMLLLGSAETIADLHKEYQPAFSGQADVLITDPEYLEFMKPGNHKGKAILALMKYYGISEGEALVFGDGNNDIPMLELDEVVSFAMNNATEFVKSHANAVAPDSYGGVAEVLSQIAE